MDIVPIQVSTRKMAAIAATVGQKVLLFTFPVQREDDLAVYRTRAAIVTRLTLATDYQVYGAGLGSVGGWAELVTGAETGDVYDLEGDGVLDRLQTVAQAGKFKAALLDGELNRMMMLLQEARRDVGEVLNASSLSAAIAQIGDAVTDAEAAAVAAAASFDSFDDRYLGAKAADPTTDNDGNALVAGQLYYNTTSNVFRFWNGSVWGSLPTYANFVGDTGAGGGAGLVPAPAAGNAANGFVLGAGGAWLNELPGRWGRPKFSAGQTATTSQVATDLTVALAANEVKLIRGQLLTVYDNGFGANTPKFDVTGPAAPDEVFIKIGTGTIAEAYSTIVSGSTAEFQAFDVLMRIDNGANAGTVTLRLGMSTIAPPVYLRSGSYLEAKTL